MTTFLDRLFGRDAPARKAVYGGPALVAYQNGVSLSVAGIDWQSRARAFLDAYRVGWFYKAGSRISRDFANLDWTLAYEDVEGDNEDEIVAPANDVPFAQLDPLEQFLRLAEHPNPWQTGRALRQQQQIRLDFTGRALLYLENGEGGGLPTALFGISPARMWPSLNAQGQRIGWVLDPNRPGGGVPFSADEIVAIEYPGAEDDPVGVVEAVYPHVGLTRALPQHTSDVLATGGRLAGMAWPKERSLSEDEFADAQRAWRNVTSDPNAARRLLLFPEPMEYAAGAATPSEIGIPELATLNRDEILSAFPINPALLGVPLAAGLNSGDTLRHVRHDYWEGTQHPRVEVWEDAFQQQVMPRYEKAVGRPLDFDIEEPNLDDAAAIIEKADALDKLIAIGFDEKEAVAAVALDHIKFNGKPEPVAPPVPPAQGQDGAMPPDMGSMPTEQMPPRQMPSQAKAARRADTIGRTLPGFQAEMRAILHAQRDRLIAEIERVIGPRTKAERKALPDDWWNPKREDDALREAMRALYVRLARSGLQVVADELGRLVMKSNIERITAQLLERGGARIVGINETTRQAVADAVAEGVRRGYSIAQIVNGVPDEGFPGVRNVPVFDEARAEVIARTETMLAYNESALLGYQEFGVAEVEAIDGDFDPECAARDGQVFTVEDALAIEDHPNGTLDWAPIAN